jgi:hypothetical protein
MSAPSTSSLQGSCAHQQQRQPLSACKQDCHSMHMQTVCEHSCTLPCMLAGLYYSPQINLDLIPMLPKHGSQLPLFDLPVICVSGQRAPLVLLHARVQRTPTVQCQHLHPHGTQQQQHFACSGAAMHGACACTPMHQLHLLSTKVSSIYIQQQLSLVCTAHPEQEGL